jgi:hypothetical protein
MLFCYILCNWKELMIKNCHGRKQRTKFGESTSSDQPNELGVAQGSCLSPSLFIFYMNRIAGAVGEAIFNLFAGDTLISVAEDSLEVAVRKINNSLHLYHTGSNNISSS